MVSLTPRPLYSREKTLRRKQKSLSPAGNRTPTVQPVAMPTELSILHTAIHLEDGYSYVCRNVGTLSTYDGAASQKQHINVITSVHFDV
jgi:hypothetical protein